MAKVIATSRGYYGGIVREPGDTFNAEGKASWFEPADKKGAAAAEKSDAPNGDGKAPATDLEAMTVKDLRALAKDKGIALAAGVNTKAEIIDAIKAGPTVTAPSAEPFSDAPEPVRVKNEVNELTGATQPDWVQG